MKCPRCGGDNHKRIHRKWWMRIVPGAKRYLCDDCKFRFLIFLNSADSDLIKLK